MASMDNLNHTLTVDELRKGGINSAKARKERKAMKDQLEMLLNLPVKNKKLKEQISEFGIDKGEINNQMAMTIALYREAMRGNTKAYELIRDTLGEKPVEKIQNLNPPVINIERPKSD